MYRRKSIVFQAKNNEHSTRWVIVSLFHCVYCRYIFAWSVVDENCRKWIFKAIIVYLYIIDSAYCFSLLFFTLRQNWDCIVNLISIYKEKSKSISHMVSVEILTSHHLRKEWNSINVNSSGQMTTFYVIHSSHSVRLCKNGEHIASL